MNKCVTKIPTNQTQIPHLQHGIRGQLHVYGIRQNTLH